MPKSKTRKKSSKPTKVRFGRYSAIPRKLKFIIAAAVILVVATIGYLQIKSSFAYTPATILYYDQSTAGKVPLNVRTGSGTVEELRDDVGFSSAGRGASFTPDGSKVLFVSDRAIIIIDRATLAQRQLTTSSDHEGSPRVSPDGIRVTFWHHPSGPDSQPALSMINLDGSNRRLITQPGEIVSSAADWSPDGTRLAFITVDANADNAKLWNTNTDGTDRKLIDSVPAGSLSDPEWSPDGKFLFYSKGGQIHASNLQGKIVNTGAYHNDRIAVSNDWNMYFSMGNGQTNPNTNDDFNEVRRMWLGDFTYAKESLPGSVTAELGDVLPSGPVLAAPAGFLAKFGITTPPPPPPPAPTPPPTANKCKLNPVLFIGARGSGEKLAEYNGFGSTIFNVANTFASQIPLAKLQANNFESIGMFVGLRNYDVRYGASVSDGVARTMSLINNYHFDCPNNPIVLAGYSQGAHVVGNTYAALNPKIQKNIAAVLMFGDPRFNGEQKGGVNFGQEIFDKNKNGIFTTQTAYVLQYTKPQFKLYAEPREFKKINGKDPGTVVRSYCLDGDTICNAPPLENEYCKWYSHFRPGDTNCPHAKYDDDGWADQGALWAAQRAKAWKP